MKIPRVFAAALALSFLLTACGEEKKISDCGTTVPAETECPVTEAPTLPATEPDVTEITDQEFRPAYGQGNCKELWGDAMGLVFLVDDDASSWTEWEVQDFLQSAVRPGFDYLEKTAFNWGSDLRISYSYFYTDGNYSIRYPGVYDPDLGSAVDQYDLMDVLAMCLGFRDRYEMDDYFRAYFDREEIMYLVAFNSGGTCYTMPDNFSDGFEQLEYSVYFRNYDNGTPVEAFTVAHETMHLYGAEDYYDPYGDLPRRKALAEQLYPDDLMLRWDADVNHLSVSDVTAYTVGWTDVIPEVVYWPEWWS